MDHFHDFFKNIYFSFQANGMFNEYVTGLLENSNKFVVLFKLLEETIKVGERILLFSQSLLTLDLIEIFLQERTIPSKIWFSFSTIFIEKNFNME